MKTDEKPERPARSAERAPSVGKPRFCPICRSYRKEHGKTRQAANLDQSPPHSDWTSGRLYFVIRSTARTIALSRRSVSCPWTRTMMIPETSGITTAASLLSVGISSAFFHELRIKIKDEQNYENSD